MSAHTVDHAFLHCYIGDGDADPHSLVAFARGLHDGLREIEQIGAGDLMVRGDAGCLTVSEVDRHTRTPFRFSVSLTIFRPEQGAEHWLEVRFARDVAEYTHSTVYCNVPPEVRQDEDDFFQIRFKYRDRHVHAELVELDDRARDTVLERGCRTIDLGAYSGFTDPPGYEFPGDRDASPP